MNAYDPRRHGVCPYPRPVIDTRDQVTIDEFRAGRGWCACGLEVRFTPSEDDQPVWTHYVGDTRVEVIVGDPDGRPYEFPGDVRDRRGENGRPR